MSRLSRRRFVQGVATGAVASMILPTARVLGANESINIGFIGLGGRGMGSVNWFSKIEGVTIAGLCDPDRTILQRAKEKHPDAKAWTDLRGMLDDKDIHAVCISTCNHWHALAAIWACQAGKDVYVEKPVSHNVWEGRKMVEAARKYKRIVQGGTQQRSDAVQQQIKDFLASGQIGKPQWVHGSVYAIRESIGKRDTPLTPPSDVDYNLWLGPAQDEPIYRTRFHYDWHWVWNTGNGEMGNWGIHILDDVRNTALLDKTTMPLRVVTAGGRVAWNDAGQTPNVQFVYFDTGSIPVLFDLTNLPVEPGQRRSPVYKGIRNGYVIHCEGGYYAGARGGGAFFDNEGKRITKFNGSGGREHATNFIAAIRSRKPSDLNADIEVTHDSTNWCHAANIGFHLGKQFDAQATKDMVQGVDAWASLVDRFTEHMAANNVDLAKSDVRVSPVVEFDPKKETLVGPLATPQNLALLRREYRAPFTVPEKV